MADGQEMTTDAQAELYRVLMSTAEECPLPVLGSIFLALAAVVERRLHEEMPGAGGPSPSE